MADELRERVARRLYRLVAVGPHFPYAWTELTDRDQNSYRVQADECIRLMEWARRECTDIDWIDYEECEVDTNDPLTLPPDDWKVTP